MDCLGAFPLHGWLFSLLAMWVVTLLLKFVRTSKLKLPPGPLSLPIIGNWLHVGGNPNHRVLAELAKKYGDVFLLRMGHRNLVVVSSPELAKEVLHRQGMEFGSRARNLFFDIYTGKGQDLIFASYGEHWRRMRRIITLPFFTNMIVQQSRLVRDSEIDSVIKDVKAEKESANAGIVLRHRLQLMMYNIVYRITFDRRFEGLDDPLFLKVRASNYEAAFLAQRFECIYGDCIPVLRPLLGKYMKQCQAVKDTRLNLFKEHFVEQRKRLRSQKGKSHNNEAKCVIDYMLESLAKGEMNEENLLHIIDDINVAAIETTLLSVEWGLAELVNHPHIQHKVRNEIESVLGKGVLIAEPHIPNLPFLKAFVKETLRYHMVVPQLLPHMNVHEAKLGGYDIPPKSKILVNAWWLANSPKLWEKPDEFRPDRFVGSNVETSGNELRFIPFGVGRRSCPGMGLALPIISLAIGRLVSAFELLPPHGKEKLDLSEMWGQFSNRLLNHSVIVLKPRP